MFNAWRFVRKLIAHLMRPSAVLPTKSEPPLESVVERCRSEKGKGTGVSIELQLALCECDSVGETHVLGQLSQSGEKLPVSGKRMRQVSRLVKCARAGASVGARRGRLRTRRGRTAERREREEAGEEGHLGPRRWWVWSELEKGIKVGWGKKGPRVSVIGGWLS